MSRQLISIAVGGAMTSLQLKRGLDLRRFGKVSIHRSSLIKWDEREQMWFIELLEPSMTVTVPMLVGLSLPIPETATVSWWGILHFKEYDDAVACEIEVIQELRKQRGVAAVA